MREREVERHLIRQVKNHGGLCFKWVSPGCVGVPDRIVILNERIWLIELKAPGKSASPTQRRIRAKILAQYTNELKPTYRIFDNKIAIDNWIYLFGKAQCATSHSPTK